MKVLLINGSPHKNGTTFRALSEVASEINKNGIETEIITVGNERVSGCMACGGCVKKGRCVYDDVVNVLIDKIRESDGVVIGTPVYYASPNGTLISILDRVFYARADFEYKVGASIAVARRAGTTASLDVLNKYFTISNMPVCPSVYWNMAFGNNSDQVELDEEGMQTMRVLGDNMSWLIKCIKSGKDNGIVPKNQGKKIKTNFIR